MNCNHFQTYLTDLLAGELSPEARARLEAHAAECPACAAAWAEARCAIASVTPTEPVTPAADFRARVLKAVRRQEAAGTRPAASTPSLSSSPRRRRLLRWMAGGLSAAAVLAVALTVGLHTPLRAARQSLRQAVVSMNDVQQVAVHFRVRTDPRENFAYTDARLDLLPHTLQIIYRPEMVWRLEKAGRTICSDGKTLYQWLPDQQEGWIGTPADSAALLLQLDPRLLLMREQAAATAQKAVYRVERADSEVLLTVTAPARGNFSQSDYMRNTSIAESSTRREYRFDAGTGRLLSGRILLLTPQGERTIVAIDRIDYDVALDTTALMERPEGVDWIDTRRPVEGNRLAGIGAAEAGRLILQAFRTWDRGVLDEALFSYGESSRLQLRDRYAGSAVVEIADPVHSGLYPGLFLPCKLLLPDGSAVRLTLALRNDNPQGVWLVDGGL